MDRPADRPLLEAQAVFSAEKGQGGLEKGRGRILGQSRWKERSILERLALGDRRGIGLVQKKHLRRVEGGREVSHPAWKRLGGIRRTRVVKRSPTSAQKQIRTLSSKKG